MDLLSAELIVLDGEDIHNAGKGSVNLTADPPISSSS
jgi:hypothetical protein